MKSETKERMKLRKKTGREIRNENQIKNSPWRIIRKKTGDWYLQSPVPDNFIYSFITKEIKDNKNNMVKSN